MNNRVSYLFVVVLLMLATHVSPGQKTVRGKREVPPTRQTKPVPDPNATTKVSSPSQREEAERELLLTLARFIEDGQVPAAKEGFLRALKLDPTYPQPMYNLAVLAEVEDDRAGAVKWFGEYLKFDQNSRHAQAARSRVRQLQAANAGTDAEAGKSGQYLALLSLSQVLAEAGFFKEAIAQLDEAARLDDTRWESFALTAALLSQQGLFEDAKGFEDMARLRTPPDQKAALESVLRLNAEERDYAARSEAGVKAFAAKDYLRAAEEFSRAWSLFPQRTEAAFAAAVAFTAGKDNVEAAVILNRLKGSAVRAVSEKASRMLQELTKKK